MIQFSEQDRTIFIQADGHITAQFCTELKNAVFSRLDSSTEAMPERIHVDLSGCTYMDSTFIGILAGIHKKLKKNTGNKLHVQNVQPQCKELLQDMGVWLLFDTDSPPVQMPEHLSECKTESASAKDILDAHENLMEISDKNKERFSTLHTVLKSQIKDTDR